jgi:hypothetical protein
MTKEQMLELCISIKKLNMLKGGEDMSAGDDVSFAVWDEPSEGVLEDRIAELWAVYCGTN